MEDARADVGGEGAGEKQDEAGRGGDAEGADAQQPEQEADHRGALERAERRQAGSRHAYLGHGGEEPSGLREIDGSGPGVGRDRDSGDDHVSGVHVTKPARAPARHLIHVSIT